MLSQGSKELQQQYKEFIRYKSYNKSYNIENLQDQNKINDEFRQYLSMCYQRELLQEFNILSGQKYELEQIIEFMIKVKLTNRERDMLNKQLVKLFCDQYKEMSESYIKPETNINDHLVTLAMWLVQKGYLVPKQWIHNYTIKNKDGQTLKDVMKQHFRPVPQHFKDEEMNIFDQAYFGIVPSITNHEPYEQDEDGFTVAMILELNNIEIPYEWHHEPEIQNKYGYTVAMYQAMNGKIPEFNWEHYIYLRCKYRDDYIQQFSKKKCQYYTVQNILQAKDNYGVNYWSYDSLNAYEDNQAIQDAKNGIIPELKNNEPQYQNIYGYTVAMLIAKNGNIPPEDWEHSPILQNCNNMTVAMYLASNGIVPPEQWYHDPSFQNSNGATVAMLLFSNGIMVPEQWQHNPLICDNYKNTIGMTLSKVGILPPQQWMHDIDIKNDLRESIHSLLHKNFLPVPHHWKNNDMTIFDKACYGIVPELGNHKPNEQNEDGQTIAMILACNNIKIPQCWYHDSNILDVWGNNAIVYIATRSPQNFNEQWKFNPTARNQDGNTIAMIVAKQCIIPPINIHHDPAMTDKNKNTVAMLLAENKIIPPKEWEHNPALQNDQGNTVAMILTKNKMRPQKQWYHKPEIQNLQGDTVAIMLALQKTVPPKQWLHNVNLRNKNNYSLRSILNYYDYIYHNDKFIYKYKTFFKTDICQICFNEEDQEFIKTKCGHMICLSCFKQLKEQKMHELCPVCRQEYWYQQFYFY